MFLKVGTLAVLLTFIAVGNAQPGPPGPPGVDSERFPKYGASAPGHNIPEDLLIFPEVSLDAFVDGAPVNPEDPQSIMDVGPEHHTFSDPRGPIGFRDPLRRFFPFRDADAEYQSLGRRTNIQNDMEP
ncbi:uncharacterized protein LOC132556849 [Ylistrum balloti]|uniref:uncharacterized protein LOC132556849 n=1 Tax=Ylistrum balloti TaxID=509963 RepID=UPI0029057F10|nr:uncharacterized protein LOC132556849 [Ylistrum balloti]